MFPAKLLNTKNVVTAAVSCYKTSRNHCWRLPELRQLDWMQTLARDDDHLWMTTTPSEYLGRRTATCQTLALNHNTQWHKFYKLIHRSLSRNSASYLGATDRPLRQWKNNNKTIMYYSLCTWMRKIFEVAADELEIRTRHKYMPPPTGPLVTKYTEKSLTFDLLTTKTVPKYINA